MNKYEYVNKLKKKGIPTTGNHRVAFNDTVGSTTMDVWNNVSSNLANMKASESVIAYVYHPDNNICHTFYDGKFARTDEI